MNEVSPDSVSVAGAPAGGPVVFETPWFRVEARPAGPSAEDASKPYYVVCPGDYVSVLATTPDGELLLVQVYRPTIGGTSWELPSGMPDRGEAPEETARRELREETGCEAGRLELMGVLHPDTGRMGNRMHCFRAWDVVPVTPALPVASEVLAVRRVPHAELHRLVAGDLTIAIHAGVLALAMARGYLPGFSL